MLSSISWHQNLTTISGICVIYYFSILLWFYKSRLLQFVGLSQKSNLDDSDISDHEKFILGKAKTDEMIESVSAEELEFSETNQENENPLNPISDED
jgi:hypothetical protein